MAVSKNIYLGAFFITLFLFITILFVGNVLNQKREQYIDTNVDEINAGFLELQTFFMMADTYGDEMACLAFEKKLRDLDESIWNLGLKIDQYRVASEEFQKDPYFLEQKYTFNENEVFYLLLLKRLKQRCDYKDVIVLFFYQNSVDCKKCDDQSFVLTDINKKIDDEIAIFSFDMDLNISSLTLLKEYYEIGQYPCTVIDEKKYCGMQDKDFLIDKICEAEPSVSVCETESADASA